MGSYILHIVTKLFQQLHKERLELVSTVVSSDSDAQFLGPFTLGRARTPSLS